MILIEKELLQFEVCEVCGCLLPVGVDGSRLGRIYSSRITAMPFYWGSMICRSPLLISFGLGKKHAYIAYIYFYIKMLYTI